MTPRTWLRCGLCAHPITFPRCGVRFVARTPLCHSTDHSCYERWTVYHERPTLLRFLFALLIHRSRPDHPCDYGLVTAPGIRAALADAGQRYARKST